jgi:hypothetical protein
VARRGRIDKTLRIELEDLEQRLFLLKINYDKYFNGIENKQPTRDRDALLRTMREMTRYEINNTTQRYKFRTIKARYTSLDQYLTRNLVMIERGTHPKFKFRADLKDKRREELGAARARRRATLDQQKREEVRYRDVYQEFVAARRQCGQRSDLEFRQVRKALQAQVSAIKTKYKCSTVKLRVSVVNGKAKVKAVPIR